MTLREFVAKAPANKNLCIAFGIGSGWLVIGTKNEISFKAIDQEQHKARNFDLLNAEVFLLLFHFEERAALFLLGHGGLWRRDG